MTIEQKVRVLKKLGFELHKLGVKLKIQYEKVLSEDQILQIQDPLFFTMLIMEMESIKSDFDKYFKKQINLIEDEYKRHKNTERI